jgi:hypothetical protein
MSVTPHLMSVNSYPVTVKPHPVSVNPHPVSVSPHPVSVNPRRWPRRALCRRKPRRPYDVLTFIQQKLPPLPFQPLPVFLVDVFQKQARVAARDDIFTSHNGRFTSRSGQWSRGRHPDAQKGTISTNNWKHPEQLESALTFTSLVLEFTSIVLRFTSTVLRFNSKVLQFTSIVLKFTCIAPPLHLNSEASPVANV